MHTAPLAAMPAAVLDRPIQPSHPIRPAPPAEAPPHFQAPIGAAVNDAAAPPPHPAESVGPDRRLYEQLLAHPQDGPVRAVSRIFLERHLDATQAAPCDLPAHPDGLAAWLQSSHERTGAAYADYLAARKAGAPRRYFSNRAHALYTLRAVAPTKLTDGAWLHGLARHWQNPRFAELLRTYLEELGDGDPAKNHVLLYRRLLARYGLDAWQDQPDAHYTQGAVQLALALHTDELLAEVVGFNLGYEQLPLHLLITTYELNELGIDPYYFQLHVTVDNADTGHAQRAVQAVRDALPRFGDADAFWQRVRNGYRLNDVGLGTNALIAGFDIQAEVERVFAHKSVAGHVAHSDYCRVAGRSVNDWLADRSQVPAFLQALEQAGWIRRNQPASESRFWHLLQGPRAEMFGVFSDYELQLIHDWIRGDAAADGLAFADAPLTAPGEGAPAAPRRVRSWRARQRMAPAEGAPAAAPASMLDPDIQALDAQLAALPDATGRGALLAEAMAPAHHWTAAGLYATQRFRELAAV